MILRNWNSRVYFTKSGTYFWHYEEYEGPKEGLFRVKYWINYRNPYENPIKDNYFYKKVNKKWVLIKEM